MILRVAFIAGLMLAMFPFLHGFATLLGFGDVGSEAFRVVSGLVQIVSGLALASGLVMSRRRYSPMLVAVGAIALAAVWYWTAVIILPLGAGLVFIAVQRGKQAAPTSSFGSSSAKASNC